MVPIMLHHIFASWAFFTCVSITRKGTWFGTVLLLTEATNPFNNTHWFLQKSGQDNTKFFRFIELGYAFTWTVFRICLNPYLLYKAYIHYPQMLVRMSSYHLFILWLNISFLGIFNTIWWITGPFYNIVFEGGELAKKKQKSA